METHEYFLDSPKVTTAATLTASGGGAGAYKASIPSRLMQFKNAAALTKEGSFRGSGDVSRAGGGGGGDGGGEKTPLLPHAASTSEGGGGGVGEQGSMALLQAAADKVAKLEGGGSQSDTNAKEGLSQRQEESQPLIQKP